MEFCGFNMINGLPVTDGAHTFKTSCSLDFQVTLSCGTIAMIREEAWQVCYLNVIRVVDGQSDLVDGMCCLHF